MKLNRSLVIAVIAALLSGGVMTIAATASSQTPIDPLDARDARRLDRMEAVVRELRSIVFQGRDTGHPVVVEPAGADQMVSDMNERVTSLEQTLTRLNSDLETVTHDLDTTRQTLNASQRDNAALTQRVTALEQQVATLSAPPPAPPEEPAVSAPPRPPRPAASAASSADTDFTAARRLLLDGDYAAAEGAFETFLGQYGDTPRAPEARYYYGKTLMARRAYQQAATAFLGAIREWPQTSWAPDAVLDLSRALVGMNRKTDACQTLNELARHYPRASTDVRNRAATLRTQAGCAAP